MLLSREKRHYMRDFPVKKKTEMIKIFKANKFGNFAADEEHYEPTCG